MTAEKKKEIVEHFEETYQVSLAVQKPFGEAIQEIMKIKNLTVSEAMNRTGLNRNIFSTMKKPGCNIELRLVISMCIGFQLDAVSTHLLLESAGLSFNMSNPIHRAYLYVIEYYKDTDIETCNGILECLGVPESKRLGSYERKPYKKG